MLLLGQELLDFRGEVTAQEEEKNEYRKSIESSFKPVTKRRKNQRINHSHDDVLVQVWPHFGHHRVLHLRLDAGAVAVAGMDCKDVSTGGNSEEENGRIREEMRKGGNSLPRGKSTPLRTNISLPALSYVVDVRRPISRNAYSFFLIM